MFVGLTGSMGVGKSQVADYLKALGAEVVDADLLCRELVEPGKPAWQEVVDTFGEGILQPNRSLDRAKLAALIFNAPEKKKLLENILHPRVFEEEQKRFEALQKRDPDGMLVVDAALLIESGNYRNMDVVVVVQCDPELQIRRLRARNGWTADEVRERLQHQMSQAEKAGYADFVLTNNSSLDDLKKQVEDLFRELSQRAQT